MLKKLIQAVTLPIVKFQQTRKLNNLQKQLRAGAIFLRVLNDEIRKMGRHEKKRFIKSLYSDGKLSEEIVQFTETKSDYIISALKGKLKVYKKKRVTDAKANAEKIAQLKKEGKLVKQNAEQTTVNNKPYTPKPKKQVKVEAVDGAEFYKEVKEKEAKGELPGQVPVVETPTQEHIEESHKCDCDNPSCDTEKKNG